MSTRRALAGLQAAAALTQRVHAGDLFELLTKDTKLPEQVVQSIAKQLVQALHYLHR